MRHTLGFEHILTPAGLLAGARLHVDERGYITALEEDATGPFDGWLALPGMPNAHSHAFQRALAGHGEKPKDEDSFWSWREAMYALAGRIDAEALYVVARRAFTEMLAAGFTSVGEFHYLHHARDGSPGMAMGEALTRAAQDSGIRLALLPVFYHSAGFAADGQGLPPQPEQQRFVHRRIDEFGVLLERLGPAVSGIAAHSLRAVPAAMLQDLTALADTQLGPDSPLHIHISEQPREVAECRAATGDTPIAWLAQQVALGPRWSLVHATHATEAERQIMAQAGVQLVLCPLTEAYLADGIYPAAAYRRAGGHLAVGSDSNVRIDAVEEMRLLEYGQRLSSGQRACLSDRNGPGQTLWSGLAAGGARSLGLSAGAIEPGRLADLVVLDPLSAALSGVDPDNALDALLTGGDARCIGSVYVGGRRCDLQGAAQGGAEFARCMQALWI